MVAKTMTDTPRFRHPIVYFDGICNLCSSSVQFLIRLDPKAKLKFASLQSDAAQSVRSQLGISLDHPRSIVVEHDGKLYEDSSAIIRALYQLGFFSRLLGFLIWLIPKPIRNAAYRIIASNRYRWFGRKQTCWLPTPELRARFLE